MARLRTTILTGTLAGSDGVSGRPGVDIYLTEQVGVRPLLHGTAAGEPVAFTPAPSTYPDGTAFPVAVPLFSPAGGDVAPYPSGLLVDGSASRHTTTDAQGGFILHAALPGALGYSEGARTDADIDPARDGRWTVSYSLLIGEGSPIEFTIGEAEVVAGSIDITSRLAGPGA